MLQNQDYYRIIDNYENRVSIKKWIESKTDDDGFAFKNVDFIQRKFITSDIIEIEIVAEYNTDTDMYTLALVYSDKTPMEFGHWFKRLNIGEFKAFLEALERKRKINSL
jgi:hypothetical protein